MHRFLFNLIVIGVVSSFVSCNQSEKNSNQVYLLSLQSWTTESDDTYVAAQNFADICHKASNGQLEIKVYPAGKKIPQGKEFEGVISGLVDLVHGPPSWTTDYLPGAVFFSHWVNGFSPNQLEMWMKYEGRLLAQKLYEEIGVHFVGILTLSPAEVWAHTVNPLKSVKDIKGLSIRVGGGDMLSIFQKMGASPVLLPGSKIYGAAKEGAIQAFEYINPTVNYNMNFFEVAKYMYLDPSRSPCDTQVLWVNKLVWDKLPKHIREIISMANDKVSREFYVNSFAKNLDAIENFKKQGVSVESVPEDILELLKEKSIEYFEEESEKDQNFKMLYEKSLAWKKKCERSNLN